MPAHGRPDPQRLRAARIARGLSQPALARKMNCHLMTIWNHEAGRKSPNPVSLREWARVCGVPIAALCEPVAA